MPSCFEARCRIKRQLLSERYFLFVHIVKDFMRKLEDVEKRLDISLDRDEIQTLGLKLRFYFNETRHYKKLLNEVQQRIIEIQNKFGFVPEEVQEEIIPEPPPPPKPEPITEQAREAQESELVGLVSDWLIKLEESGVDPRKVLQTAGAPIKVHTSPGDREDTFETSKPKEPVIGFEHADNETAGIESLGRTQAADHPAPAPVKKPRHEEKTTELKSPLSRFTPPTSAKNVSQLYRKSFGDNDQPVAPVPENTPAESDHSKTPVAPDSAKESFDPAGATEKDVATQSESQDMESAGNGMGEDEKDDYWVRLPERAEEEPEAISIAELVTGKRVRGDTIESVSYQTNKPEALPANTDEVGTPIDFEIASSSSDVQGESGSIFAETGAAAGSTTDSIHIDTPQKPRALKDKLWAWRDRLLAREEPEGFVIAEMRKTRSRQESEVEEWIDNLASGEGDKLLKDDRSGILSFCAGFFAAGLGRMGAAVNRLEEARAKSPQLAECYVLLGDLYFNKSFYSRALESYREAEDKTGPSQRAGIGIIRCLAELKRPDDLINELESREFEKRELRYEALLKKAGALAGINKTAEAAGMLEGLMETTESDKWRSIFALKLAQIKKTGNDIVSAIKYFEKCIELDSSNKQAQFELGALYLDHNAIPLARNQLLTLIKKFPESSWADQARDLLFKKGVL